MRYTVQSGAGEFGSFRVIHETPEEALRTAQDLMERGSVGVRIIDEAGRERNVDAFSRQFCGHTLTPHQAALIKATSDVLRKDDSIAAHLFYDKLFELAPETRPLFAANLSAQKEKLLEMLVSLVDNVMSPKRFIDIVGGLGRRHATYGARPEHYGPVGQALLFSLEHLLETRFTPEVKAAWTSLYLEVARAMTEEEACAASDAPSADVP